MFVLISSEEADDDGEAGHDEEADGDVPDEAEHDEAGSGEYGPVGSGTFFWIRIRNYWFRIRI